MRKKGQINYVVASTVLILLMMCGCTSVEIDRKSHDLSFRAIESQLTKGSVPLTNETIGVYANLTGQPGGTALPAGWAGSEFWKSAGDAQSLYIRNACFARRGGNAYTGVSEDDLTTPVSYYWPNSGSLMFSVYSPHISQSPEIKEINYLNYDEAQYLGYMLFQLELNPSKVLMKDKPFDLLYADPMDINAENSATLSSQKEPVPVKLRHALTKVTFNIRNEEGRYTLTAALKNCINSCWFYSGMKRAGCKPVYNADQKTIKDYKTYDLTPDGDVTLGKKYTELSLILIPMRLDGAYSQMEPETNIPVTLHLEVKEKDNVGKENYDFVFPIEGTPEVWETGKHYTYNINIRSNKIEFGTVDIKPLD